MTTLKHAEKAGDTITIHANQAGRDGTIVARLGDEIMVEYTMPAGTSALRQINLNTGREKSVSYRSLTTKWGNAIEDQTGIAQLTIWAQQAGSDAGKAVLRAQVIEKFEKAPNEKKTPGETMLAVVKTQLGQGTPDDNANYSANYMQMIKDMVDPTITLHRGGTGERTVSLDSLEIKDLWHAHQNDPDVMAVWHLAHSLKRELLEVHAALQNIAKQALEMTDQRNLLLEASKRVYERRTDILNAANRASIGTGGLEFALQLTQTAIKRAEGRAK